ncbi:MAG: putative DNA binding domain-containing protein [Burkholderiales bacterium]|nr:putative DNA binding domain-containing protein [Burkholderiales bacterium]
MSLEGQLLDRKSLRAISGRTANWDEIAKDCIAFANATGGRLQVGIENDQSQPPTGQQIPPELPDTLRRRISEKTVNVVVLVDIITTPSGGQYLDLVIPRSVAVASTTDGRYFIRVADQSKPVTGDDVMRLASERSAVPWESQITLKISRNDVDITKQNRLIQGFRASDRVKDFVKEKTDTELIDHYQLTQGNFLTNLGVLCIGHAYHRSLLATAPAVQFIKYDELGQKVNKLAWDDHTLSPIELIETIWQQVPDFREHYELPEGLYRQNIPAFDEVVIRELLVNAFVHRPYTQRGDIFLNLSPDRLEVVNPGLLPMGVTPNNILHTTVRRNEHLARIFHDLKLMEREGSGFDKIFEVLLSQGRPAPEVKEIHDRVVVTIRRRISKPEVIDFIASADQTYHLTQRERIALGLLVQQDSLAARELVAMLELSGPDSLGPWLKRLLAWQIVRSTGRTKAARYFVDAGLMRSLKFTGETTLKRIEPHRLLALILEDLKRYPGSAISDVHQRIGKEIHQKQVKRGIDELVSRGIVRFEGDKRWRRYSAAN